MQTTTQKITSRFFVLVAVLVALTYVGTFATAMRNEIIRVSGLRLAFCGSIILLVGIGAFLACVCAKRGWDRSYAARWALVVAAILYLVYLRWDCAPAAKVYTWADVEQPSSQCNESRMAQMPITKQQLDKKYDIAGSELVSSLASTGTSARILSLSNDIEAAWNASTNYRGVLAQLDTFSEIATVSTGATVGAPLLNYLQLRSAAQLHWCYARLKALQGQPAEGVSHLSHLYSISRKTLPYSGSLVEKMVWIGVAGGTINAASMIALDTNTPCDVLRLMKDRFPPLQPREAMLRNTIVYELALFNWAVDVSCVKAVNLYESPDLPESLLANLLMPCLINPNITRRAFGNYMEPVLAGVSKLPMEWPYTEPEKDLFARHNFLLKNPGGRAIFRICMPSYIEAIRKTNEKKILSDLLAVYLGQRLGETVELNDMWTGKLYPIDEKTGTPFSPGPDKTVGTQDDVKMPKIL